MIYIEMAYLMYVLHYFDVSVFPGGAIRAI